MVLPDSHGIPRAPRYSGTAHLNLTRFRLQDCYLLRCVLPDVFVYRAGLSSRTAARLKSGPATPHKHRRQAFTLMRFGLFPVRSPLLGESRLFSSPPGTKMFQFPGSRLRSLIDLGRGCLSITSNKLPHSEIPGSKPAYGSPRLIAAGHVLLRLLTPRHPP